MTNPESRKDLFRDNKKHMTNPEIRKAMFEKGMVQWQLAKLLGISETSVWKLLREELPADKKEEILRIINGEGNQQ